LHLQIAIEVLIGVQFRRVRRQVLSRPLFS
jgi:hypothetical protein